MKNWKLLFYLLALTTLSWGLASCEKDELLPQDNEQVTKSASGEITESWDVPEVDGALVNNISSENALTVDLPENIFYVARPVNGGQTFLTGGTKITCECTENAPNQTGGCSPARIFGSYGCAIEDGCTTCKKTTSSTSRATGVNGPVNIFGVVDYNKEISLITDRKINERSLDDLFLSNESDLHGQTNEYILDIPQVIEGLEEFQRMIFADYPIEWDLIVSGVTEDPRLSRARANLYGNEILLIIPTEEFNMISQDSPLKTNGSGGKVTCDCDNTSQSGCTKKKGPGYVSCKAGACSKCTMSDES